MSNKFKAELVIQSRTSSQLHELVLNHIIQLIQRAEGPPFLTKQHRMFNSHFLCSNGLGRLNCDEWLGVGATHHSSVPVLGLGL